MGQIEFDDVEVTLPSPQGDVALLREVSGLWTEERIALIGSNGSGKSTLARLINGLVTATRGSVVVNGLDVADDAAAVRRQVGFCFTDPAAQFAMPTAIEDVAMSLRRTHRNRRERHQAALEVLESFGLADKAELSVHSLSGGQKQLLALASVLASGPEIVVADEPTTLLDLRNTNRIADVLFGLEQQLILVTHDLGLAERCDRAIVVADGRIAFDGDPSEAVHRYRNSVGAP